jgi:L-ascorbate metabolism protein UlaG (beta-lactamase superfamily)
MFTGDTDASPVFAQARRRLGRHDVALVPIGAWSPRWQNKGYHVEPEDAVAIARALGASRAIGMHFATYALTPEPYAEQVGRFCAAGRVQGVATIVPRIGGLLDLTKPSSSRSPAVICGRAN